MVRHSVVAGVFYTIRNGTQKEIKTMKYTYEQYETFYYLNRLLPYLRNLQTIRNSRRDLILTVKKIDENLLPGLKKINPYDYNTVKASDKIISKLEKALANYSSVYLSLPLCPQQDNISYLVRIFNLNIQEEAVIRFLGAAQYNELLRSCLHEFHSDLEGQEDALTEVSGCLHGMGFAILNANAPLRRLGILRESRFRELFKLTSWAQGFINTVHKNDEARYQALLGTEVIEENPLNKSDFAYVEAADLALKLIKQAKHHKGFNILLYGVPGTGKTSFAKYLAHAAKLKLYPVGVCSEGEIEQNYRLQQFYRKQFLLKNVKNACILFDEGEDIFSSLETRTSKMEINNLLENNEVPVIWTTNKIHRMDPAFIRRFTLPVCFNKPPVEVRQKIWHKYLTENKIVCGKEDSLKLAKKYEVPPSMIAGATHATHMAKGDLNTVKDHLSFMTQALNGGYKKPEENTENPEFETALVNADINLDILTEQITHSGRLNFSLCLYGASGTGKSAYAQYLAQELGLDVLHRRASDLLSKWVGGTEQNIAEAFAQAKENKSLLIFDEADSFLRDRATASHSWEISGVNEMLTWMESHPYPFICTTNLMDTLDPASLRRFSFKIKYDFLTLQQVVCAFMFFFHVMIEPQDVVGLDKLTPGDFALVKNKTEILGHAHDFYALKEMLETEQKLKHNAYGSGIGFRVN